MNDRDHGVTRGTPSIAALRIGIDVREWKKGTSTGIARVLTNFVSWTAGASEHQIVLFGDENTEPRCDGVDVEMHVLHERTLPLWDHFALPRALARTQVDVFLSPYYKGPLRTPCPVVVTANDLIDLHFRSRGAARRWLLPSWMRLMLRRASHVLTLSEYARQDIVATLGVDASRITAVPLAVDDRFAEAASSEEARRVRATYDLPERYVLYVGRCAPHKNVDTLVRAWAKLPSGTRRRHGLVLAGGDTSLFRSAAERAGVDAVIPGFVPDADLPGLYGGATILGFPSLYEGFGLPPLEAMACGTPVIASSATAMPEVLGEAARLLDPRDVNAWTNALSDLVEDNEALEQLTVAGLERASLFTRERSGSQMLQCLLRAAAPNSR